MARIAKALATLREQVNAKWPNRSKVNDGWIGDSAHSARKSDHNPNARGVVQALDITNDPAHGIDAGELAQALIDSRDPRIKYVISNSRIASGERGPSPWVWRKYSGSNAHEKHVHISVADDPKKYDDASPWADLPAQSSSENQMSNIDPGTPANGGLSALTARREPLEPRLPMGLEILNFEARRDSKGRLAVYRLPPSDGGGTYEVAGINDRYHPEQARKLKILIDAGQHKEAEAAAAHYILAYTDRARTWTSRPGVEFFLRDSIFNRGPRGAARILQRALRVPDDGIIGPVTMRANADYDGDLLAQLRWAREDYEREVVGYRPNFWNGLVNRWNKALATARRFEQQEKSNG